MNTIGLFATAMISVFAWMGSTQTTETPLSIPAPTPRVSQLFGEISSYLDARKGEFDLIDPHRKELLRKFSDYIRTRREKSEPVALVFVCTHNSRRSQMAQLWAAAAGKYYGINVLSCSGGTESTAFNPRTVAAMSRAGFKIEKTTEDGNPVYHVRYAESLPALTCFSKKYDGAPNPKAAFAAVMVCDSADKACPTVPGAAARFAISFVDPKVSDNSPQESATYDQRCAQIAREMMFAMSLIEK